MADRVQHRLLYPENIEQFVLDAEELVITLLDRFNHTMKNYRHCIRRLFGLKVQFTPQTLKNQTSFATSASPWCIVNNQTGSGFDEMDDRLAPRWRFRF